MGIKENMNFAIASWLGLDIRLFLHNNLSCIRKTNGCYSHHQSDSHHFSLKDSISFALLRDHNYVWGRKQF